MAARRSSSFLRWLRSQVAFEGSNGIEEFVSIHIFQRTSDRNFFRTQRGDRLDVGIGLGLAAFLDRLLAVLFEVGSQVVQEARGEAIASPDWLASGVATLPGLKWFEAFGGHCY